ncbi:hypothetical protein Hte_002087 [Hypoxylon texense]
MARLFSPQGKAGANQSQQQHTNQIQQQRTRRQTDIPDDIADLLQPQAHAGDDGGSAPLTPKTPSKVTLNSQGPNDRNPDLLRILAGRVARGALALMEQTDNIKEKHDTSQAASAPVQPDIQYNHSKPCRRSLHAVLRRL